MAVLLLTSASAHAQQDPGSEQPGGLLLPASPPAEQAKFDTPALAPDAAPGLDQQATAEDGKSVAEAPHGVITKEEVVVDRPPDPGAQAPAIGGLSGLFRLVTSDIGRQHTFRIALHTEMFLASDFLAPDDTNSRFIGTLALSYTPWRYLEFALGVRSQANRNERVSEPNRPDPEVIYSLGDLGFAGKFQYPVHPAVSVGANVGLYLLNSVGGVSIDGGATSFYGGALSSFDIGALSIVPVRIHANFGYMMDNSDSLQSFPPNSYTLASLNVSKFALGINRSRFQMRLGIDAQLRRWTKIGLSPIIEWGLDIATGSGDSDFARYVGAGLSQDAFDGRVSSSLTVGVRVSPLRGVNIDVASDIGLASPGYGHGPPVTPWNLILGLSYAFDPAPPLKVITRERIVTPVEPLDSSARVRGRVVGGATMAPVQGAVVTFPGKDLTGLSSDPDGGFLSYAFAPGRLMILVRHPDFKPAKATARLEAGTVTRMEVRLDRAAPKTGRLTGRVVGRNGKGVAAAVSLVGPQKRQLNTDDKGEFTVELMPGRYDVQVSAAGKGRGKHLLTIAAGEVASRSFALGTSLDRSLVRVTNKRIVIRRKIHFASGAARLRPDGHQLLDIVAQVLAESPQIKHVEIQGHTDSQGADKRNLKLSQARAEAVRDYLIQRGMASDRLTARGYGESRPKRPNLTAQGRAINRRVEFRILKR